MSVYAFRYNLLFVHPPKTGGTSVQEWMLQNVRSAEKYNNFRHVSLETLVRELNLDDPFSFATVRNPYSRVISAYFYEQEVAISRINYLRSHPNQEGGKHGNLEDNLMLLEEYSKGLRHYIENHMKLKPQVEYTEGVSLILKIEEINQKFKIIQKLCQCKKPLPILNTSKHKHYTSYYDKKTRKLVSRMFIDDINKWGYEFGD